MWRRGVRLVLFIAVCAAALAACLGLRIGMRFTSPVIHHRQRMRITQSWARALLNILGLRVNCELPSPPFDEPCLLVSNHQSYLDILIIAAHCPALFVAKSEVARWPLLGWLAALGGTLFIERNNTLSNVQAVYRVSHRLRQGERVLVFPEGTTSKGTRVLPFRPLFCAAALRAAVPVLPLTIQYQALDESALNDETRDLFCWYGEMNFVRHFWQLLSVRSSRANLQIHSPLLADGHRRRDARTLAALAEQTICDQFSKAAPGQTTHQTELESTAFPSATYSLTN